MEAQATREMAVRSTRQASNVTTTVISCIAVTLSRPLQKLHATDEDSQRLSDLEKKESPAEKITKEVSGMEEMAPVLPLHRYSETEATILDLQTQLSQSEEMKRTFHEHLEKAKEELDGVGRQKEEDEQNNSALQRKIAALELQVADLSEQVQEETRIKLSGLSRIRQLEIDLNHAGDEKDEAEQRLEQVEKEMVSLRSQMEIAKKKADEGVILQLEEFKKKAQRDFEISQKLLMESEASKGRILQVKKKIQQELENVHIKLEMKVQQYETEIRMLRGQQEELEDQMNLAEDARLRLEVNSQVLKAEYERALSIKEQAVAPTTQEEAQAVLAALVDLEEGVSGMVNEAKAAGEEAASRRLLDIAQSAASGSDEAALLSSVVEQGEEVQPEWTDEEVLSADAGYPETNQKNPHRKRGIRDRAATSFGRFLPSSTRGRRQMKDAKKVAKEEPVLPTLSAAAAHMEPKEPAGEALLAEKDAHDETEKYDAFISYRWADGTHFASLIATKLRQKGYKVWMDVNNLGSGEFPPQLRKAVKVGFSTFLKIKNLNSLNSTNFIHVLTENSIRKEKKGCTDHVLQEIRTAFKLGKNVIPVRAQDYQFPEEENIPKSIRKITKVNNITWYHECQRDSVDKIVRFMKKK